jgi:protein TonB
MNKKIVRIHFGFALKKTNKGDKMKIKQISVKFFVVILFFAGSLYAGATGEVFGSVTYDGILIPGVTVEAESAGITGKRTTVTNEEGSFRFQELPAGEYRFFFKLLGFKTILLKEIKVKSGKKIELKPKMIFGTIIEEIVVIGVRKVAVKKKDKTPANKPGGIASITKPLLIKKVNPKYPDEALEKGFHGDVVIHALINESGNLTGMRVKEGKYACLITAAVEALKNWKYKPYMMNGVPSSSEVSVRVMFKLKTGK